eukprot:m.1028903 g.1028903  ORF g.1028903 m.1028903 type:complete len:141 (-) comp24111_c0_seq4:3512-3934(-)
MAFVARPLNSMNKFSAERAIQERRQRAYNLEQAQARAAQFYQDGFLQCDQNRKWGSDASFAKSMRSWQNEYDKEDPKKALEARRDRLSALLSEEMDQYTKRLTERLPTKEERIESMRVNKESTDALLVHLAVSEMLVMTL